MSTSGDYPFVRHDAQIAVALEDEHGEEQTDDAQFRTFGKIVDSGEMPDPEVEWQEERNLDSRGRELSGKEPGRNTYDGGSLTILPTDEFVFEYLFGNSTDGDGVIEVSNAPLPDTATVEATYFGHGDDDDFVRRFIGNAPDSGTIEVDNESRLQVGLEFVAQGVDTPTDPVDVDADDGDIWLFTDADSYLTLHGTDYARVTDFSWELSNELDPRYYIQPNDPEDPYEVHYGNAGHSLEATVVPVDDSLFEELVGRDDAGDADISFVRPDDAELKFEFGNVGLEAAPHEFPEEGSPEVGVTLIPDTGKITYDDGSA